MSIEGPFENALMGTPPTARKPPSGPSVHHPSSTFVVRLWHEGTAEDPHWRGRVEHLQSGESKAFLDADGLLSFVRRFGPLQEEADEPARTDS